jgi:hypothetical protein
VRLDANGNLPVVAGHESHRVQGSPTRQPRRIHTHHPVSPQLRRRPEHRRCSRCATGTSVSVNVEKW